MQNAAADTRTALDRASLAAALSRVAEGDRPAFAEVYLRTSAKLFGICLRISGSRSEAEEAMQEAYIKVWQKAAAFDPGLSSPITWLAVVARNKAIDRLRARGRSASEPLGKEALALVDTSPSASDAAEAREESRLIAQLMSQLDDRQESAIRRAFFGGATYEELAFRDGVPLGTVKSRVKRGLARLKSAYHTQIVPEEDDMLKVPGGTGSPLPPCKL